MSEQVTSNQVLDLLRKNVGGHWSVKEAIAEIERLQMKLKNYEPVNLYDGRDIDSWRQEALRLQSNLDAAIATAKRREERLRNRLKSYGWDETMLNNLSGPADETTAVQCNGCAQEWPINDGGYHQRFGQPLFRCTRLADKTKPEHG